MLNGYTLLVEADFERLELAPKIISNPKIGHIIWEWIIYKQNRNVIGLCNATEELYQKIQFQWLDRFIYQIF